MAKFKKIVSVSINTNAEKWGRYCKEESGNHDEVDVEYYHLVEEIVDNEETIQVMYKDGKTIETFNKKMIVSWSFEYKEIENE